MFTGIIEAVGKVSRLEKLQGGMRLALEIRRDLKLRKGESLAVDGVCLTCETLGPRRATFVLSKETLDRSRFGSLKAGSRVNLERALAANARLGGHFVQGHVDGVGAVLALEEDPPGWSLSIELPGPLAAYCVEKGSVAINGVSLTIARIRDRQIWMALIPYTMKETALGDLAPKDPVNLEIDILAKYVRNFLHPVEEKSRTEEFLLKFLKEGETAG